MTRHRRSRPKRGTSSAASQAFTCVDTIDEITTFLGLLDMCLHEVEGSSEVEDCVYLLVDSFLVQVKPRLQKLHHNLYSLYQELSDRS